MLLTRVKDLTSCTQLEDFVSSSEGIPYFLALTIVWYCQALLNNDHVSSCISVTDERALYGSYSLDSLSSSLVSWEKKCYIRSIH